MWAFLPEGFVSIVQARQDAGRGAPDPDHLQLRARLREHLETLKCQHPAELGNLEIIETPKADYRYRLLVSRKVLAAVMSRIVMDIQYTNVKNEAALAQGESGRAYVDSLHAVWSVMHRLQQSKGKPSRLVRLEPQDDQDPF